MSTTPRRSARPNAKTVNPRGGRAHRGVSLETGSVRARPGARTEPVVLTNRLEQVVAVLKIMLRWQWPSDQVLSQFFKENRYLGSRDRAQVAQAAFHVLRNLRRFRREAQSAPVTLEQALAVRGLAATLEADSAAKWLSDEHREWVKRCEQISLATMPFEVRYSLPDWIAGAMSKLSQPSALGQALLQSAPLDLRVNTLKISHSAALEEIEGLLRDSPYSATATPYASNGIRLSGHPPLNRWALFEKGFVEVQDEGSQLLAELVAPRRGEMVVDFCAGAGGKTLALAAMMRSAGRLYAFDISAARLARAKPRFARSGLSNVFAVVIRGENDDRVARLAGKAHRVLVDAPCTGLGTLRRNPDLKWRLSPDELARLIPQQASILQQASQMVRPGGRLVYATCSFLPEENEDQVHAFLEKNPGFVLLPATECLPSTLSNSVGTDGMMRLRPDLHHTDGFFAAVLQKKTPPPQALAQEVLVQEVLAEGGSVPEAAAAAVDES